MVAKRLTKSQKIEILEGYRAGKTSQELADEFKCSTNTVNRTVKSLTTDEEYNAMKKIKTKESDLKKKDQFSINPIVNQEQKLNALNTQNPPIESLASAHKESDSPASEGESHDNQVNNLSTPPLNIESSDNENANNFEEIVPLDTTFTFEEEKQKISCQSLKDESLPEVVYMLVDKKVEIEEKTIAELTDWNFLPQSEKERNAILLFINQRSAKRNCNRNQRVIKVPNTNIFKLLSSYLIEKGITRLILEDSLISIDS